MGKNRCQYSKNSETACMHSENSTLVVTTVSLSSLLMTWRRATHTRGVIHSHQHEVCTRCQRAWPCTEIRTDAQVPSVGLVQQFRRNTLNFVQAQGGFYVFMFSSISLVGDGSQRVKSQRVTDYKFHKRETWTDAASWKFVWMMYIVLTCLNRF